MNKYRLVDLFCGAGGLSLGFEQTGRFQIAGAMDHWNHAINTFRHNHPELPASSLINEDANVIATAGFDDGIKSIWEEGGPVDVVVGGPPCQGLSLAGKRITDDSRNQLFNAFVAGVAKLRPRAFVMENVPGLLSMKSGFLNTAIIDAFREIGYRLFVDSAPLILKAEDYGVPQLRRRLFYVGFFDGVASRHFEWPPKPTHSSISTESNPAITGQFGFDSRAFDNALEIVPTVREAISDLPIILSGEGRDEMDYPEQGAPLTPYQQLMRSGPINWTPRVYNHEAPGHTQKLIEMIQKAAPGASVDPKYSDSKKWDPEKPGFTVKALGAGGGSTNRRAFHYDPDTPRGSTARENARIQSFPDWFRFTGAKTHQMTQVGNAVPPLLAQAIAKSIACSLDASG